MSLFRLTINKEFKDEAVPGDRTLAAFITSDSYLLSTYNYGNVDMNLDEESKVQKAFTYGNNKGDWTFFYFGYSMAKREAFAYIRYYEAEDSVLFKNVNHYVATYFHLFIGNDRIYK